MNLLEALGEGCKYRIKQTTPHCNYDYIHVVDGELKYDTGTICSFTGARILANNWQRVPQPPQVPDGYRLMTIEDKVIPIGRKYWGDNREWCDGDSVLIGNKFFAGAGQMSICPIEGSWTWASVAMDAGLKVRCACWRKGRYIWRSKLTGGPVDEACLYFLVEQKHKTARNWELYTEPKPTQEEVDAAHCELMGILAALDEYSYTASIRNAYKKYIELKAKREE